MSKWVNGNNYCTCMILSYFHRQSLVNLDYFGDQQDENVPRVHCCTAKFFCRYDFSQCGIDKRRSTEKDCSYFVDDNIFLSHCRNIGSSSSTTSNHYCQLNKCYLLLAFYTRKSKLVEFNVHLLQTARFLV